MAARQRGNKSPKEFVRIGICVHDRIARREDATATARRKQSMHQVNAELQRSYTVLAPMLQPDDALPCPMLTVWSAPGGDLRRAVDHVRAQAPQSGLIRLAVHDDLEDNLDLKDLAAAGIPLLISVGHASEGQAPVQWAASRDGIGKALVSDGHLTRLLHDIVLDIWIANHLDATYRALIEVARLRGDLFRRKVKFILNGRGGDPFLAVPPHKDAGYVSFATICRDAHGALALPRLFKLWREFAAYLGQQAQSQNENDRLSAKEGDHPLPTPIEVAQRVARQCRRSLRVTLLASQIARYPGRRIAIVVLMRSVKGDLAVRAASMGLRRINSTSVFATDSLEWVSFRRMAHQLKNDGILTLEYASVLHGAPCGNT